MSTRIVTNPRLAALRNELSDAAVVAQGLAHRLSVHGHPSHARTAHQAARQLAEIVRALGNGFSTTAVSQHFPHLCEEPDEDEADSEGGTPD